MTIKYWSSIKWSRGLWYNDPQRVIKLISIQGAHFKTIFCELPLQSRFSKNDQFFNKDLQILDASTPYFESHAAPELLRV